MKFIVSNNNNNNNNNNNLQDDIAVANTHKKSHSKGGFFEAPNGA